MAVLSLAGGDQLTYSAQASSQTPEEAYAAWASALGVSATETLLALSADDQAFTVTLGAPVFALGPAVAMFSSEAGLGFYRNAISNPTSTSYLAAIPNVSRMYGLWSRPSLLLSFHPQSDLKSFDAKVQRSGATTIFYSKFSNYGDEGAFLYHAAVKLQGGTIELIGKAVTDATTVYWTELVETTEVTTVVQQAAVVTQAVGETWRLSAAMGLTSGLVSAPSPLREPAVWGYVGNFVREAYGAVPTPLAAPRLLGVRTPQAQAAAPALLQAPALMAVLVPQGWGAAPSPLAAPSAVGQAWPAGSASAPSMLSAAGVLATHDFTGQLGDAISAYVMDLVTPEGVVRVPISSWQATLRTAGSNYVQCVAPACLAWVDRINAATEFVIWRRAVLPSGVAIEYEMARTAVEQRTFDRGSTNYTATLSGYTPVIAAGDGEPPAALDRTLTGVRSISSFGSDRRVRCSVDWLLRPGQRAWVGSDSFVVEYINYYVLQSDHYMDCGGS